MKKIYLYIALITLAFFGCTSDDGVIPVNSGSVGKIAGTVLNESGQFLNGAKIKTTPQTSEATTDLNGAFQIFKVPGGTYTVTASLSGYNPGSIETKVAPGYATNVKIILTKQSNENHPPLKPFNPTPANQTAMNQTDVTLSWDCSDPDGDEITYAIYLGTGNPPAQVVGTVTGIKTFQVKNLQKGKQYYWRIVATDSKDASTNGDVWYFFITDISENHPPIKPFNPVPQNNSTIDNTQVTLSWDCSDPDGDALNYDVWFGTNSQQMTKLGTGLQVKNFNLSKLNPGYDYFWKVVARDSKGAETTGDIWTFKIASTNHPPTKPSNPSPVNGAIVTKTSITFSWDCSDPDGDAISYDFYIRTENSNWGVQNGLITRSYAINQLSDNTKYIWKIVAKDSHGATSESDEWSFTTNINPGDLMDKILAYYKFDGNTNDASGNGFNAQNHGVTFETDRNGKPNSCGYWGPYEEYVLIPYPQQFALKGDFTIALWIKPDLSKCKPWDTHIDLIGKSNFRGDWTAFGFTTQLGVEFWVNNVYIGYDYITMKNQKWNHIAVVMVKDGSTGFGTATLYLNGTKLGDSKRLPMPTNNTDNVWLGERADQNSSFSGWIDDLYFFNRALTDAEILQLTR